MEIKIKRINSSKVDTVGVISINGVKLCSTVERPEVQFVENPLSPHAIPKGKYNVEVVVNPMQGTPVLKVVNPNIPHNVSIRCMKPMSIKNTSITLCNLVGKEARPSGFDRLTTGTEPMIKEWSMLLVSITKAIDNDEEINLVIL